VLTDGKGAEPLVFLISNKLYPADRVLAMSKSLTIGNVVHRPY
jgi:hypothetical protein